MDASKRMGPRSAATSHFPRAGTFLDFVSWYLTLNPLRRAGVYVSPSDRPGFYDFATFDPPIRVPADWRPLVLLADLVAKQNDRE